MKNDLFFFESLTHDAFTEFYLQKQLVEDVFCDFVGQIGTINRSSVLVNPIFVHIRIIHRRMIETLIKA